VTAGGEDEDRLGLRGVGGPDEDEGVGDLRRGDSEGIGGGLGGAHRVGQVPDLGVDAVLGENREDPADGRVLGCRCHNRHRSA
jgi:hypothetical protein